MKRWLLLALLVASGCATAERRPSGAIVASRLAVLPPHNETKNEDGALVLRQLAARWLTERGYVTVPSSLVDKELAALGVSDVSVMTLSQMRTLSERTGADGFIEVDVLDFAATNRGFSHERRVAAGIRLVSPTTGISVWQNSDQVVNKASTVNPTQAIYDYLKQWGAAQLETALKSPLFPEANTLVTRLLKTLPPYNPS